MHGKSTERLRRGSSLETSRAPLMPCPALSDLIISLFSSPPIHSPSSPRTVSNLEVVAFELFQVRARAFLSTAFHLANPIPIEVPPPDHLSTLACQNHYQRSPPLHRCFPQSHLSSFPHTRKILSTPPRADSPLHPCLSDIGPIIPWIRTRLHIAHLLPEAG